MGKKQHFLPMRDLLATNYLPPKLLIPHQTHPLQMLIHPTR